MTTHRPGGLDLVTNRATEMFIGRNHFSRPARLYSIQKINAPLTVPYIAPTWNTGDLVVVSRASNLVPRMMPAIVVSPPDEESKAFCLFEDHARRRNHSNFSSFHHPNAMSKDATASDVH